MIDADIPDPRAELERKCMETITELALRVDQGRLPAEICAQVARALWSATAGLVDQEISSALSQVAESAKPAPRKRHFIKGDVLAMVAWYDAQPNYLLVYRTRGVVANQRVIKVEVDERAASLDELVTKLIASGLVEI